MSFLLYIFIYSIFYSLYGDVLGSPPFPKIIFCFHIQQGIFAQCLVNPSNQLNFYKHRNNIDQWCIYCPLKVHQVISSWLSSPWFCGWLKWLVFRYGCSWAIMLWTHWAFLSMISPSFWTYSPNACRNRDKEWTQKNVCDRFKMYINESAS